MRNLHTLIILFFSLNLFAQKKSEISFGILYADILSVTSALTDGNTWRRGFWVTYQQSHSLNKNKWLFLDTGLTYQERIPLEVLRFPFGNPNNGNEGAASFYFSEYPTNPQHKLFNDNYKRLTNFKYLTLEIIPQVVLESKNNWKFKAGAGIFGSILLNRDQTTVTKDDLPNEEFFFGPPFNVYGEVIYTKYDYGWIPKIGADYWLNEKMKLGVVFKSYHSVVRLNDTFIDPVLVWNMKWIAIAGGVSFQYIIW